MKFRAAVELAGKTATILVVPDPVVAALGRGRRPAVRVSIAGHAYRTTVAVMGGRSLVPLNAGDRAAAGLVAGEEVEVELEFDDAPRVVVMPADLEEALSLDPAARRAFEALSYTDRKEWVRSVEEAKRPETRDARVSRVFTAMREGPQFALISCESMDMSFTQLAEENARRIAEHDREVAEIRRIQAETARQIEANSRQIEANSRAVEDLVDSVKHLDGRLSGLALELAYRNHPFGYFGTIARRARTLTSDALADLLGDGVEQGLLTDQEATEVALADVIVAGRQDGKPVHLVVEVSRTIHSRDVSRAAARAGLLARLGTPARGVVAGVDISDRVAGEAETAGVRVVLDGRKVV